MPVTPQNVAVVAAVSIISCVAASLALRVRRRVPPVLVLLLTGMLARLAAHSVVDEVALATVTKPICGACLTLVGMLIGSHLNAEGFAAVGPKIVVYLLVVFMCVFSAVHMAVVSMFPALRGFAPLVASIALERSSPEALAGITTLRARGPFTSVTMLSSAVMDCAALVAFVLSSASMGGTGAGTFLARLAAGTYLSYITAIAVERFSRTLPPAAVVVALAAVLNAAHYVTHTELLVAAIGVGTHLNFRVPHATLAVLETQADNVHLVLFVLSGLRIDVAAMVHLSPLVVVALYVARLVGLWAGCTMGSLAAGYPVKHVRCLGLVTQLAIALSLVQRVESAFPEAAELTHAAAGMVLLSLLTGPGALLYALRLSGETHDDDDEDARSVRSDHATV
jgi:hypothetical protein